MADDRSAVVIVGAGPTGMVAALVLAANGIDCRLVERRTAPSTTSRALGLQARSMELLAGLGVADRVAEQAYRLSGASIMRADEELARLPWVPPDSPYPYTYVLPQQGLEAILRERIARQSIPVDTGTAVDELTQTDDTVHLRLTDGRRLRADWVIGADGSRSRVREQLGVGFIGRATGEVYYLADAVLDPAPRVRDSALWLGAEGPLMLMRLPGDRRLWRIFVDVTDQARSGDLAEPTDDILQAILRTRGSASLRLAGSDWRSTFRTRVCLAESYRTGRVFLAGDAAHVFPPFGGQGMNLGIQDAYNIGWRLARTVRTGATGLLDDYAAERRPIAEATIRDVELRRRAFALRNPVARRARDLLLRATSRSQAARNSRQNSQLDQSYAARRPRPAAVPKVGDRAPDGPLGSSTVHAHLGPGHSTLLRCAPIGSAPVTASPPIDDRTERGTDPIVVQVDDRVDPQGKLRTSYGIRHGGFVLIRPDGHLAERSED